MEEETEERRNTWLSRGLYALITRGAVEANSLLLPTTTVFRNGSRLGAGFLSSSRLVSSRLPANAKRDSAARTGPPGSRTASATRGGGFARKSEVEDTTTSNDISCD